MSSRPARATWRDPVRKQTKQTLSYHYFEGDSDRKERETDTDTNTDNATDIGAARTKYAKLCRVQQSSLCQARMAREELTEKKKLN